MYEPAPAIPSHLPPSRHITFSLLFHSMSVSFFYLYCASFLFSFPLGILSLFPLLFDIFLRLTLSHTLNGYPVFHPIRRTVYKNVNHRPDDAWRNCASEIYSASAFLCTPRTIRPTFAKKGGYETAKPQGPLSIEAWYPEILFTLYCFRLWVTPAVT